MAFKMKNQSMAKMVKMAGSNRAAMKMKKESTMKMGHSPKKLKDLSGDGKVTRKDVLIGRGVLNKDGSKSGDSSMKLKKSAKKLKKSAMEMKKSAMEMKKGPMKKTYKEAYKDADKNKYKTYEEFEKAAKAYNIKKYGTTEPTKAAKQAGVSKKALAEGKKKVDAGKGVKLEKKVTSETTVKGVGSQKPMAAAPTAPKSRKKKRVEKRASKAFDKSLTAKGKRKERLEKKATKLREKASTLKLKYKK